MTKVRSHAERRGITFVVPVRNDAARLKHCLDRIRETGAAGVEIDIIVVDHGSIDDSARVARQAGATVLRIDGGTVADLRNHGARLARWNVIAFVDADHEIDPRWAAVAFDLLRDPGTGAAGAPYHAPTDGTWVQRIYDGLRTRSSGTREVAWLGSGNLAVRRDAYLAVNGFDQSLETCEDVDLCGRLRAAGWRVVSDDRLRSVHLGDPPTLRALFAGELWRGRDNLRISLRGPIGWRDMPSIVIPMIDLAAVAVAATGVLSMSMGGAAVAAGAAATIAGLASLRAARIVASRRRFGVGDICQSLAVAAVYDMARALALVSRAPHEARRAACVNEAV
jgi:glycosyl transferase family 2